MIQPADEFFELAALRVVHGNPDTQEHPGPEGKATSSRDDRSWGKPGAWMPAISGGFAGIWAGTVPVGAEGAAGILALIAHP